MYLFVKRLLDIILGLIGIIILIPMCLIIKIIFICTGDFHSIFYFQKRVGKKGKIFTIVKFRTMVVGAEKLLNSVLKDAKLRKEYEFSYKLKDDPRLTKVGKTMRALSIDEFPQFINILLGHMSVVGPRPIIPEEIKLYGKKKKTILSVKPGLTCYWVLKGRSNISYKRRADYEVYYVKNANLFFDISIFFKSIIFVFKRVGAS